MAYINIKIKPTNHAKKKKKYILMFSHIGDRVSTSVLNRDK